MIERGHGSVAVRWLIDCGVWLPGKSHSENMARCAEYRATKRDRLGAPASKQWAQDLVERYQQGQPVPVYFVRLACDALDRQSDPILRNPKKPFPKPDAKQRQANDVEVEF